MRDGAFEFLDMSRGENQRQYKRARTLLYQGEVPRSAYVIKRGVVRTYNIAENGEERTVELLSVGHVLPVSWVFDISSAALYYYEAFSDTQVYVMSRERFLYLLEKNNLEKKLIQSIARRYTATTMHLNALLQSHAQDKIAQGLQYLILSHGKKLENGRHKINVRLTQQDIANLVGVTRETAAVELNRLRDRGVIQYASFTYTVDYDALIRMTGSDEFSGLEF